METKLSVPQEDWTLFRVAEWLVHQMLIQRITAESNG